MIDWATTRNGQRGFYFYLRWLDGIEDDHSLTRGKIVRAIAEYCIKGKVYNGKDEKVREVFLRVKEELDSPEPYKPPKKHHGRWKGGISPENRRIRTSVEYKKWRLRVFSRDSFTCQVCGQVGGSLKAHHIKPFSTNPGLRFDINNGITLCAKCHWEYHKTHREWLKK